MLVPKRVDPVARQTLVDHAGFARAALLGCTSRAPEFWGSWTSSAGRPRSGARTGCHQPRAALPWRDRLGTAAKRSVEAGRRMVAVDGRGLLTLSWRRRTALCVLSAGSCGPAEDRRVAQLMTAALNHMSTWLCAAAQPDHLQRHCNEDDHRLAQTSGGPTVLPVMGGPEPVTSHGQVRRRG